MSTPTASLAQRLGSASEARWLAEAVPDATPAALEALVARRLAGEPLQYVLGSWAFRTLELACDPRALIPRPETEQVVDVALGELRRVRASRPAGSGLRVADLGTGTGAIALSIAAEVSGSVALWASDVDPATLDLARENARRVAATHPAVARRVTWCEGSWYEALPAALAGELDLVVSNPPYVAEEELAGLDPELAYEPRRALVAPVASDGTPGLGAIEVVVLGARTWLAEPGALVVELAPHQAAAAVSLARAAGFGDVAVRTDLAGRARTLVARTG